MSEPLDTTSETVSGALPQVAAIAERLTKGGSGRRKENPVRVQRLVGRPNPIMTVRRRRQRFACDTPRSPTHA